MIGKAIYLGYRNIDYAERTLEDGTKMPALKGKSHTFFQNTWKKGALAENGMFLNMFIKEEEKEQPYLERGQVYKIEITDIKKQTCKIYVEDEEEDD